MAVFQLSEFDSTTINDPSSDYVVRLPYGASGTLSARPALRSRTGRYPVLDSAELGEKVIPFTVTKRLGSTTTVEAFDKAVHALFRPDGELKAAEAEADGGSLMAALMVTQFGRQAGTHVYAGTFLQPDPIWRSTTTQTDSVSPLTQGGSVRALPALALTGTGPAITSSSVASPTTITTATPHFLTTGDRIKIAGHAGSSPDINGEHVVTVTGASTFTIPVNVTVAGTGGTMMFILKKRTVFVTDTTGRGLANYRILSTFDSTGVRATTTENYIVFFRGRAIPQRVNNPDNAATQLFCRIDVPPDATEFIDIYYGGEVDNPALHDALEYAGEEFEGAVISNTVAVWNDYRCSLHPNITLAWKPVRFGEIAGGSFGISAEGASASKGGVANTITFAVGQSGLANDYNGLLLVVGTEAGATNALTNFFATLTVTGGTLRARLLYRVPGSTVWQTAETRTTTGAFATTQDIDSATQIVICLETIVAGATGTLQIGVSGGAEPQLALAATPSVNVSAAVTAFRVDGTIVNTTTGDIITLANLYLNDTTLLIDCLDKTIATVAGPVYSDRQGISFSNPDDWWPLVPGSNSWTTPANIAAEIAWEDSFAY